MAPDVVKLAEVSHRYGAMTALDSVRLSLPVGGSACLIGPDGAGKSTLLGLTAGVVRGQQGHVEVLGGTMGDPTHRKRARSRIAYMPQGLGRNLYPTLSVAENLNFFGRLFGYGTAVRQARITELLAATGLAPFRDRPAGKLSGGMRQKLGICCALIHNPDLLILDEPTTGVDPLSRRQFWDLIGRVRARQPAMAVLVATAYMEEAEAFDSVFIMRSGRIVAAGRPAAIRREAGADTLDAAFIRLVGGAGSEPPVRQAPDFSPAEPAIEADGLTCRFGGFTAVDNVSFRIARGEIFGFLGSNGCGKSTTMKMLTGLLPASEGVTRLFGRPLDARDLETRRRVGYMSQSFSLYGELTVRENLVLHARLFRLPSSTITARVGAMMRRFDLETVADERSGHLPLGIRQRLQLAVALVHAPEVLILDEPTSGVDPIMRDAFWATLVELARQDGITIFLSTHFLSEAERCDRLSFMHAGRVVAVGTPEQLRAEYEASSLELAFIAALKIAAAPEEAVQAEPSSVPDQQPRVRSFDVVRLTAYAWRETLEILRDPQRLIFALLGPPLLLLTFGYGISFDVDSLPFAVFDQDHSAQSREFTASFEGSRYFAGRPAITSPQDLERRLEQGELKLAIEIPPEFGRNLMRGHRPEIGIWLDGSMPFRAETARGYVMGVAATYLAEAEARRKGRTTASAPIGLETRFRYNQAFRSANAIVPGVIMLILALIPAIMTAVAIVREKETGTIANFQATPVTRLEFLLGKQLPYIVIAFLSFLVLVTLAGLVFSVGIRGSVATFLAGSLMYVAATTAFGLLVSSFVRSQIAAIFATSILCIIPAVNFSGLMLPVSSLSEATQLMGLGFPAAWYQQISVGVFAKGLGFITLWPSLVALVMFGIGFVSLSVLLLAKQAR